MKLTISPTIGSITAELIAPKKMKCLMTLAHGAGAGMNHPFMTSLAKQLGDLGIGTLRFNFPYMEQKKNRPDVPAVAHKAIEAAIEKAHKLHPDVPLFTSGKSFGGRMTSQYLSQNFPEFVKGIIFFGFPLHAPGKASVDRADHLKTVKVPMLFLQGTKDDLAKWDMIESVCSQLPLATLQKLDGVNHSLTVKKSIVPELAPLTDAWISKLI